MKLDELTVDELREEINRLREELGFWEAESSALADLVTSLQAENASLKDALNSYGTAV